MLIIIFIFIFNFLNGGCDFFLYIFIIFVKQRPLIYLVELYQFFTILIYKQNWQK